MLRQVGRNIWVKEQPLKYSGLEVGTRMTMIRLSENCIVLISPIKLEPQTQQEINALGTVEYIIAPNLFHYLYLEECKNVYQTAKILAPPGLETKQPNLEIDQVFFQDKIEFNSELEYIWFRGFQVFDIPKAATLNEVVFYHRESKTLILTDTAFNFDRSFPWITQLAAKLMGSYDNLRPSLLEKLVIEDKQKVKTSVEKILNWDFQRVIMAHGSIVENNAKKQLKKGYEWFLNTTDIGTNDEVD
ncbi:MAG: DUF4336 domain-containing protein [Xenococcaceae cyanobacterium MO_207.B15]|nr:DUF4336 domain-containing protein [Xenococcaceae cyanobacterium MO_207.B15]